MKRAFSLLAISAACLSAPTVALADTSFSLGIVALSVSNGLGQNNPDDKAARPALQEGVDIRLGSGVYQDHWHSTGRLRDANIQIALNDGRRGPTEQVSHDVGLMDVKGF